MSELHRRAFLASTARVAACLGAATATRADHQLRPYMDALAEAKQNRQVRAVGVSCHNLAALRRAADVPWVDVVLSRINPRGVRMDGSVEDVTAALRRIKEQGKAVIGMKIF